MNSSGIVRSLYLTLTLLLTSVLTYGQNGAVRKIQLGTAIENSFERILKTAVNNYLVFKSGNYSPENNNLLIKYDPNFTEIWRKSIDRGLEDLSLTADGGFIGTGMKQGPGTGGIWTDELWVIRFDQNGNVFWQRIFGGDSYERGKAVRQKQNGNIVVKLRDKLERQMHIHASNEAKVLNSTQNV